MFSRSRLKSKQVRNSQYSKHVPLLVIAVVCFFWVLWVLISQFPATIANFLVYQSYLPLLFPFFFFVLFLSGYTLLNMKQGVIISIFITLALLFRLQRIQVSIAWIFFFMFVFWILFLLVKKPKTNSVE